MDKMLALSAALAWAGANILYKRGLAGLRPLQANLVRLLLPAIGSMAAILATSFHAHVGGLTWDCFLYVASGTLISLILGDSLFFYSLKAVGVQATTILTSSYPVFTAAIAVLLFHESLSALHGGGIVLVVLGVGLLSATPAATAKKTPDELRPNLTGRQQPPRLRQRRLPLRGISASLLAAICWAIGIALFDRALDSIDALSLTALRCMVAIVVLLPILAVQGGIPHANKANLRSYTPLMLAGFVSQGVAQLLLYFALSKGSTSVAVALSSTAPLFVILLSLLLRIERPTTYTLVGGLATTVGVVMLAL